MAVFALVVAATLTGVVSQSAVGGQSKGSLVVVAVNDAGTGLAGAVKGRPFSVVVEARDPQGVPLPVTKATTVVLSEQSGPGALSGRPSGVIPRGGSRTTITATYSAFGNGVVLDVAVSSGVDLDPGGATIDVAATAVRAGGTPGAPTTVTDPGCAVPTATAPVCGYLQLPNGANGQILMSVGACTGILACITDPTNQAGLVTAAVDLKDGSGAPLYTKVAPASFVIGCDKSLCGKGGVGQFPLLVDVTNQGAFAQAPQCPAKGRLGDDQTVCLDAVQSNRDGAGDLFSVLLFDFDIRASHP
ncbi:MULTISPECIES: hypothetical protein [unclassified Nocardioides]|uniref:hypothetical protein n=1 Tax=unclassified Nocardioides TaxID=2615069 RepID=UPI000702B013|nr:MULTISPECIES: hypothetical protein [unclassified Nocardioides]KQZ67581.1 hypothetical protein ASD66_21915 [Nocardioides sp. Root151]KRF15699.1 hypothetical protein ASH02_03355 [Nocardioides sp. Soil796]